MYSEASGDVQNNWDIWIIHAAGEAADSGNLIPPLEGWELLNPSQQLEVQEAAELGRFYVSYCGNFDEQDWAEHIAAQQAIVRLLSSR